MKVRTANLLFIFADSSTCMFIQMSPDNIISFCSDLKPLSSNITYEFNRVEFRPLKTDK